MTALLILWGIVGILGSIAFGVFALMNLSKRVYGLSNLIIACAALALLIGSLLGMFANIPTGVLSLIFGILGWGGLAAGFIMLSLAMWKTAPREAHLPWHHEEPHAPRTTGPATA